MIRVGVCFHNNNKVDTTNRCEALKYYTFFKYVKYQNVLLSTTYFVFIKYSNVSFILILHGLGSPLR